MTARSAGGRPAGVDGRTGGRDGIRQSPDPRASLRPRIGSLQGIAFQPLEEQHARSSDDRKTGTGALPITGRAIQDKLPLHRYGVILEPGSDIKEEPRPFHISGGIAALRMSGGGVCDD